MSTTFIFIFLLVLASPLFVDNVRGDDKLVHKTCREADQPNACLRCVESDPHAKNADEVGIATTVVSCMIHNLETVGGNMTDLSAHTSNKGLKDAYEACCQKWLPSSKKKLVEAYSLLKKGAYDPTILSISLASRDQGECFKDLLKQKIVPKDIMSRMRTFYELSIAAMRIVEHF